MEKRFTAEQIEKAKTCKTVDELIALAKENGIELTEAEATNLFAQLNPTFGELSDSELETVAGGCGEKKGFRCPMCKSKNVEDLTYFRGDTPGGCEELYVCLDCHHSGRISSFTEYYD